MPSGNNSTEPINLKRSEFLGEIFPADLLEPDETPLVSYPTSFVNEQGIRYDYFSQQYWSPRARSIDTREEGWLYCVSTVRRGDKPRRRLQDVMSAFVLPCDDVGTKASLPPVKPSYILETSPDNYQYGYMIDPYDVSSPVDAAYYDACLLGLALAGYNDFGCRSASRVIKLPGAIHKSGFVTRVVDWQPSRVWELGELMAAMDVDPALDRVRAGSGRQAGKHERLEDVTDPFYAWLVRHDLVTGSNDQWVHIECPWAHLHSHPEDSEAGYSPLDYGTAGRSFKCFHSHGDEHGLAKFMAWVTGQGGPSADPSFSRLRALTRIKTDV